MSKAPVTSTKSTSFAEFLESVPPSQMMAVEDVLGTTHSAGVFGIERPALNLHCSSPQCQGLRTHRPVGNDQYTRPNIQDVFLDYICSNCRSSHKRYAVRISPSDDGEVAHCYKYGELPNFGKPTPTRLLNLLGDQKEIFLKGRRCENQGLGIAAFAYYRRVVEHQRNTLLDEIIKVSKMVSASQDAIELVVQAKNEQQFLKSISMIKDALPQVLLVNGHNPMTLLHGALSAGLHEQTDERCLELAQDVRAVLGALAEKLGEALKNEAELNSAIGRLTRARSQDG